MPVAAGAPRAGLPGRYSFGADTLVAPTIGAITAPPPTPAEPAAAPGQSWRGPLDAARVAFVTLGRALPGACWRSRAFECRAYRQSGTAEIDRRRPKMQPTFFRSSTRAAGG